MHTNQIQKNWCISDINTVYSGEGTKEFNEENIRNKTNKNDPEMENIFLPNNWGIPVKGMLN